MRTKTKWSWTQPCCNTCWQGFVMRDTGEYKEPVRAKEPEKAPCCFCKFETESGIFVRVDPKVCPNPTIKE